jgi:hypothetical protein
MDCSIAILKLLLMVFNLVFFLVNLIMTILFAWKVTYPVSQGDMALSVLVIQLSLVGLTILFAFGLWVTIKRKFLLLKLFSIVLGIFIAAQVCVEAGNRAPRICSESPPTHNHSGAHRPLRLYRWSPRACYSLGKGRRSSLKSSKMHASPRTTRRWEITCGSVAVRPAATFRWGNPLRKVSQLVI